MWSFGGYGCKMRHVIFASLISVAFSSCPSTTVSNTLISGYFDNKVRPRKFVYNFTITAWSIIEKVYIFSGLHFNKTDFKYVKPLSLL